MSATENKQKSKKKVSNSFEIYIRKILGKVNESSQISAEGISQLDHFTKILARKIVSNARFICVNSPKKRSTISSSEIALGFQLILPDTESLSENALGYARVALEKFTEGAEGPKEEGHAPSRREKQAGILFSVSLAEKFIREFGASDLNVSKTASVELAAILEYVDSDILAAAHVEAQILKKTILQVRHISMGIKKNPVLLRIANILHIEFLGGGVVPEIRSELIPSAAKKKKQASRRRAAQKAAASSSSEAEDEATATPKPRRSLPGTKAISEIKKYQKSTELLLQKGPFNRAIREIAEDINLARENSQQLKDIHFGGGVIEALQILVEQRVTELCAHSVGLAIHAGRDGVNYKDVELVWKLTQPRVPFIDATIEKEMSSPSVTFFSQISNNGLERLAFRGGVKRKSTTMYPALRRFMYSFVHELLMCTLLLVKHRKVITTSLEDLQVGFHGFGINATIPRRKKTVKINKE